tara:strand:+ start:555 stop:707 length:153 start_codon:yes stop_codon:yes gene_type:complete
MKQFFIFLIAVVLTLLMLPIAIGLIQATFYLAIFIFLIGSFVLWIKCRKP